ncbi:MAG: class I mannose-6-phosphate isomerase, partial [Bacteroidales bacterium]|nr:class I mannose-6-phosphate isomerase [Candidatus Colicola faecequi]
HPDDEQAWEEQESLGKNEMWYVDSASAADASVISGFVRDMSAEAVEQSLANGDILSCLAGYSVKGGDVININTGTVHALKKGTIVAEIQENSDVTYRLYDYDRVGQDGKKRPLHISQALRALHYEASKHAVVHPDYRLNTVTNLKRCRFFTVNAIDLDRPLQRDYAPLDSFVIYMCVEGAVQVDALDAEEEREVNLAKGEALLIPACLNDIVLRNTSGNARILEIYVEPDLD